VSAFVPLNEQPRACGRRTVDRRVAGDRFGFAFATQAHFCIACMIDESEY